MLRLEPSHCFDVDQPQPLAQHAVEAEYGPVPAGPTVEDLLEWRFLRSALRGPPGGPIEPDDVETRGIAREFSHEPGQGPPFGAAVAIQGAIRGDAGRFVQSGNDRIHEAPVSSPGPDARSGASCSLLAPEMVLVLDEPAVCVAQPLLQADTCTPAQRGQS